MVVPWGDEDPLHPRAGRLFRAPRMFGLGDCGEFHRGCVRELSDLTQAVLPAVDAALQDAANDAATGVAVPPDADTRDVGSRDAAEAIVSTRAYDAAAIHEAGDVVVDAGYSSSPEPTTSNDAGFGSSSAAPTHATDASGETREVDAGFDAGARGERRPFDVAQPFEPGDAGLGVVPLFPAVGVVVDGSSSEWSDAGWLWIATPDMSIGQPQSANDLSAALAVRWDASALFLLVAVMDEHHDNDSGGFDIWGGDSIQVAFDMGQGRLPYDWEYGFAKTTQGLVAHRWREGDADLSSDMDFAVVRDRGVDGLRGCVRGTPFGRPCIPGGRFALVGRGERQRRAGTQRGARVGARYRWHQIRGAVCVGRMER